MMTTELITPFNVGHENENKRSHIVYHLLASLPNDEYKLRKAKRAILNRLKKFLRGGEQMEISEDENFSRLDDSGAAIKTINLERNGIWGAEIIVPDPEFAGRWNIFEITFADRSESVYVYICQSIQSSDSQIVLRHDDYHVPYEVKQLIKYGLHCCRPLNGTVFEVYNESHLRDLHELLLDPDRSLPIILITEYIDHQEEQFAVDPGFMAQTLQGLAYVYTMRARMTFQWTDLVGREFTAFDGAVRTYWPSIDLDNDSSFCRHHLTMPSRISEFALADETGQRAFVFFMKQKTLEKNATSSINRFFWDFSRIEEYACEVNREKIEQEIVENEPKVGPQVVSIDENVVCHVENPQRLIINQLDQKIRILRKRENALRGQLSDAESRALVAEEKVEELSQLIEDMNEDHQRFCDYLKFQGLKFDPWQIVYPDTYKDMKLWCEKHLKGRLILHDSMPDLKKFEHKGFQNKRLVCQSLQVLAGPFRDWQMASQNGRDYRVAEGHFYQVISSLGLTYDRGMDVIGPLKREYSIPYSIGDSVVTILDSRLKYGKGMDDRKCFRVYFVWDPYKKLVVVGWFPTHLKTRRI